MITRTAIFEGVFKPGAEDRFFDLVEIRLAPLWAKFPEARNLRYLRVRDRDPDAPTIVMIQQIDYPSREAMAAALASPARTAARAATLELMEMLDGRFYHVVADPGAIFTPDGD